MVGLTSRSVNRNNVKKMKMKKMKIPLNGSRNQGGEIPLDFTSMACLL